MVASIEFLGLPDMANAALVINLAYAGLDRGRYHKDAEKTIDLLDKQLQSNSTQYEGEGALAELGELFNRIKHLRCNKLWARLSAWETKVKGGPIRYFVNWIRNAYAGLCFNLFKNERDKSLSVVCFALTIAFIIVSARHEFVTYANVTHARAETIKNTAYFFLAAFILYPPLAIASGRNMARCLKRIIVEMQQELTACSERLTVQASNQAKEILEQNGPVNASLRSVLDTVGVSAPDSPTTHEMTLFENPGDYANPDSNNPAASGEG